MNTLLSDNPVFARTIQRAAQAGVILLVFYFTLIGGFAPGIEEYKWWMITFGILAVLWGGWFFWRLQHRAGLVDTRLELPLLMMLVATLLAVIFSTDPRMSVGTLLKNVVLAISLYFTLDWMRNEWRAELLVRAILVVGGIVCIIGFVELWQWYGGNWVSPISWREAGLTWSLSRSLRIKSVLHSPNSLAYYLILLIGLAFYKLYQTTTKWQRWLWISYLAMVMVTAILTQSRGGLLGAFATTLTAVILLLWSRAGNALAERRYRLRWGALGGILLLSLTLMLLLPVVMRTNLRSTSALGLRDDIWQGAIRIFLAHPTLGAGPATFPTQYMIYRNQAGHNAIFTHGHNVWLTIAAEYGIVGVLVVGYFFVMFGRLILSYLRRVNPSQWSGTVLVGVSILVGQGVHNLFDDFMEFPIFTWFTILGIVLCLLPVCARRPPLSPQKQRIWLGLVGSSMLIIVSSSLWYGRAFAAYDQARQAAEADNWTEATVWLEKSVELDPTYRFYRQQLTLAYGELSRTNDSYLALALAQQERVYDQSSSYPPDVAYLACLHWQSGQHQSAIELMRRAISIAPSHTGGLYSYHLSQVTFYFNLGYYLESAGERNLAQQAYAQVLLAFPQVGTSSYWQVSDSRRQMLQASANIAQQLTDNANQAAEIAFYSGNYQTALALYSTSPANQIGQAKSLLAMGEVARAIDFLAADNPVDRAAAYAYQTQALMSDGNLTLAEANIRKAISLSPSEPSYYYRWGHLAELQGNTSLAQSNYLRAIATSTAIRTDYATLVGHRQPLPTEQPPCLMIPYPAENLSKPSLALADLVSAQNDPSAAMAIYQNLLLHEPYNQAAQQGLAELLTQYPTLEPGRP
jgi:O-antigen ligase/tetratricopeptide (TPR) repeat protein